MFIFFGSTGSLQGPGARLNIVAGRGKALWHGGCAAFVVNSHRLRRKAEKVSGTDNPPYYPLPWNLINHNLSKVP